MASRTYYLEGKSQEYRRRALSRARPGDYIVRDSGEVLIVNKKGALVNATRSSAGLASAQRQKRSARRSPLGINWRF